MMTGFSMGPLHLSENECVPLRTVSFFSIVALHGTSSFENRTKSAWLGQLWV